MSYLVDWRKLELEANTFFNVMIGSMDVTNSVSNSNNILAIGSEEGLFNSLSQESINLELYNGDYRFEGISFVGKKPTIQLRTYNDNGDYYTNNYYNFLITDSRRNGEYITLESHLVNMGVKRDAWQKIAVSNSNLVTLESIYQKIGALISGVTIGSISDFSNKSIQYPSTQTFKGEYMSDALNSIESRGDMMRQIAQILGGYVSIENSQTSHELSIKHFQKALLNAEYTSYVYGGCLDATEDASYQTGDSMDGNTGSIDGGNFDGGYLVISDDVLSDVSFGDSYFKPTKIKANCRIIHATSYPVESEEIEVAVGSGSSLIDLSDNSMIKLMAMSSDISIYQTMLQNILSELDFAYIGFSATMVNNLDVKLGDVVAICSGMGPTRYSYISSINTDFNGSTIISNTIQEG